MTESMGAGCGAESAAACSLGLLEQAANSTSASIRLIAGFLEED
jgi:hypothetical protein